MSAQELSQPITDKGGPSKSIQRVTMDTPLYPGDDPIHWRQVVERRIQSKTKRLSKVGCTTVSIKLFLCLLNNTGIKTLTIQ